MNFKKNFTFLLFIFLTPFFIIDSEEPDPKDPNSYYLFHIKRSRNKNEVHYAIRLDKECKPISKEPAFVYWLNLEDRHGQTYPIKWHERPGFAIEDQRIIKPDLVQMTLKALPEKNINIEISKNSKKNAKRKCKAIPRLIIKGKKTIFKEVYVFAIPRFFIPIVQWVDIFGILPSGKIIKERVIP